MLMLTVVLAILVPFGFLVLVQLPATARVAVQILEDLVLGGVGVVRWMHSQPQR
jgi:hypothetical protein